MTSVFRLALLCYVMLLMTQLMTQACRSDPPEVAPNPPGVPDPKDPYWRKAVCGICSVDLKQCPDICFKPDPDSTIG